MTNATLENSSSERGDNESEQQQEKGYLAFQEGDSPAGSPRKSSSTDLESYGSDEDDIYNGAPLESKVLRDDVPSGGGNGNNNSQERIKNEVSGSSFREHDYIGLSDGGSGGSTCTAQEEKSKGRELDFGPKTRETELRLGPPQEPSFQNNSLQRNNTNPGVLVHQGPAKPDGGIINSAAIVPVDSEGRAGKPYILNDSHIQRWNRQCFSEQPHLLSGKFVYPKQTPIKDCQEPKFFNNGHEVHPQLQDYNNNGMTFLLTPKHSSATLTAGAKRVFSDAMGGAQVVRGAFSMSNEGGRMSLDSKVSGQPQPQLQSQPQPHPSMGLMYPWANAVQLANTWQVKIEQQQQHRGSFGPFPPPPTARVMVGNMMAAATAGSIHMKEAPRGTPCGKPSQDSISAAMRPPMAPSPPSEQQQKNPTLSPSNENGNSRAAPVVGWPPIRSFRKNLAPQPKPGTEGQAILSDNSFASADRGQAFGDSMFVKVNMDGVPIGRKIDLNAYNSYEKLSQALEEMFKRFVNAQGSMQRLNPNLSSEKDQPLLRGTDYVLTYEDNEGDRMLVGDVPWEMFVTTVKRLRIMKSSEAPGLEVRRQPLNLQGQLTQ